MLSLLTLHAEFAINRGFPRLFEVKKEKKLTDTGLYGFSRIWKILLDGKLDIGWFGKNRYQSTFYIKCTFNKILKPEQYCPFSNIREIPYP